MAGPQGHGLESNMRTGGPVAGHVRQKYHAQHVPRAMQELPRGTGLGHARPGPRHPEAAPGEEKKALKKKSRANRRVPLGQGLQDPGR